jgi:hypothetical protein
VRAEQPELRDHRIVGVMHGDELVALIGERGAALAEILLHLGKPVVDAIRRDQLVARVRERGDRGA